MTRLKTPLEVYKLLQKSNCGQCGSATCLAFAAAVIKQENQLADCPHLDGEILGQYDGNIEHQWFSISLLTYVLSSKGMPGAGRWVPFRELTVAEGAGPDLLLEARGWHGIEAPSFLR